MNGKITCPNWRLLFRCHYINRKTTHPNWRLIFRCHYINGKMTCPNWRLLFPCHYINGKMTRPYLRLIFRCHYLNGNMTRLNWRLIFRCHYINWKMTHPNWRLIYRCHYINRKMTHSNWRLIFYVTISMEKWPTQIAPYILMSLYQWKYDLPQLSPIISMSQFQLQQLFLNPWWWTDPLWVNLSSTQAKPGIDQQADPLFLKEAHWRSSSWCQSTPVLIQRTDCVSEHLIIVLNRFRANLPIFTTTPSTSSSSVHMVSSPYFHVSVCTTIHVFKQSTVFNLQLSATIHKSTNQVTIDNNHKCFKQRNQLNF